MKLEGKDNCLGPYDVTPCWLANRADSVSSLDIRRLMILAISGAGVGSGVVGVVGCAVVVVACSQATSAESMRTGNINTLIVLAA